MRRFTRSAAVVVALGALCLGGVAATAPAVAKAPARKKAIWGPARVGSVPQFPIYKALGVGIWQSGLQWSAVAPTRPADPTDPRDPGYEWPDSLDDAVSQARAAGIEVGLTVASTPPWANGGRPPNWVPTNPQDLADFVTAAARRYPYIRYWVVWGEPTRQPNFMPLTPEEPAKPLTAEQRRAPRYYARLLDAAYVALKLVRRTNVVIGGNSYTTGDITTRNWIKNMRLPNGKRPRMDLYGHNPFTLRRPDLRKRLLRRPGYADFSDLDSLWGWLDRYGYRDRHGRRMRVFIAEWTLPTDHVNVEFNFYVTRAVQARWLADALRIVRRSHRIYTLGWIALYDDPPSPAGDEVNRGLLDYQGRRKPSYYAFRDG
jgi:hypothetical protein